MRAQARAVACKPVSKQHRAAFTLVDLADADRDQLEFAVFDAVLEIMSS